LSVLVFALGDRGDGSGTHGTVRSEIQELKWSGKYRKGNQTLSDLDDAGITEDLHDAARERVCQIIGPRGIVDRSLRILGRQPFATGPTVMIEAFERSK
jgi:hypothetical protein